MEGIESRLDEAPEPPETDTVWEGYADYETVSQAIARSIDSAIEAYARVDSFHNEQSGVNAELAAEARARILAAALKLIPELRNDRESEDLYDDILSRWEGEDGYMAEINDVRLQTKCPGWLFQFVVDIRQAGWELGYLQAGRTRRAEQPNQDEAESDAMFDK